jgi:hypothetical protein
MRSTTCLIRSVVALAALCLAAALPCAALSPVAGNYACRSIRSKPCDTNTPLQLVDNGVWRWGRYSGNFTVNEGHVQFTGVGGPASWGSAIIGLNTLTFDDFGDEGIWEKAELAPGRLSLGSYRCQSAPGGCQTRSALELHADNTFAWGSVKGYYSLIGGRLHFTGPVSGPAGWGAAEIGDGAILFHTQNSDSVWKLAAQKSR